jgi:hypothetical protein
MEASRHASEKGAKRAEPLGERQPLLKSNSLPRRRDCRVASGAAGAGLASGPARALPGMGARVPLPALRPAPEQPEQKARLRITAPQRSAADGMRDHPPPLSSPALCCCRRSISATFSGGRRLSSSCSSFSGPRASMARSMPTIWMTCSGGRNRTASSRLTTRLTASQSMMPEPGAPAFGPTAPEGQPRSLCGSLHLEFSNPISCFRSLPLARQGRIERLRKLCRPSLRKEVLTHVTSSRIRPHS